MVALRPLALGEAAPRFRVRSNVNPDFVFDTVGGRYVALAFLPKQPDEPARRAIAESSGRRDLFDDTFAALFFVTPSDGQTNIPEHCRRFYDDQGVVRAAFGVGELAGDPAPVWFVLDPNLRVVLRASLAQTDAVLSWLEQAPPLDRYAGPVMWAPVLVIPGVFETELCRRLIDYYGAEGGKPSGFMRQIDGKTRLFHDPSHKRRSDVTVEDEKLREATRGRILVRLVPQIEKAFQFKATRMERYLVACYSAEDEGCFRPHRDNTTSGTAHRRFAVSINLNAEDYDGGDLRFPEFGPRTYRPPTGGAVVFSCSLLHEATKVTRGRRYAFLPFLYDEAAAEVREANLQHVELS